ncbi:hypothetical protein ACIBAC_00625 [Streptomyces sp. NPDC051362]|uniref:hypothetical protein n=1 Tax=Streptomyces sp. NPDC051362 TaxID=3365651 RepID=UPI0037A517F8
MSVATAEAAVKSWWELSATYGEPRAVMHHRIYTTTVPREQYEAFQFSIAGGKVLRESGVRAANGKTWDLTFRVVEYIEPVTLLTRYALDFWANGSPSRWYVRDHDHRAVIEAAYDRAVRLEAENAHSGLTDFYTVTDVV